MSVEIRPAEAIASLKKINQELSSVFSSVVPSIREAIEGFDNDTILQGQAFDNLRNHMRDEIFSGLLSQINIATSYLRTANSQHISALGHISQYGVINQNQLAQDIRRVNERITDAENNGFAGVAGVMAVLYAELNYLNQKSMDFDAYLRASSGLYNGLFTELGDLTSRMDFATFCRSSGIVVIPYSTEIYELIQLQFGFCDRTTQIIQQLVNDLRNQYPDASQLELDWRLLRLLGGLQYNYGGRLGEFRWDDVAGRALPSGMDSLVYFTTVLNISEEDFNFLFESIRTQHSNAGREGNIGDFAHFAITLSTHLATDLENHGMISNIYINLLPTQEGRTRVEWMSGWLGDATIRPISFGPDDFKADLDAATISHIMRTQGLNMQEAFNRYFSLVGRTEELTRSAMFLEHTPMDIVIREIRTALISDLVHEAMQHPIVIDYAIQTSATTRMLELATTKLVENEEVFMDSLREIAPDTYNFIRSLEENENIMGDFTQ